MSQNALSPSESCLKSVWHNRLYLYSAAALVFGIWFSLKVAQKKVSSHWLLSLLQLCAMVDTLSFFFLKCWFVWALLITMSLAAAFHWKYFDAHIRKLLCRCNFMKTKPCILRPTHLLSWSGWSFLHVCALAETVLRWSQSWEKQRQLCGHSVSCVCS